MEYSDLTLVNFAGDKKTFEGGFVAVVCNHCSKNNLTHVRTELSEVYDNNGYKNSTTSIFLDCTDCGHSHVLEIEHHQGTTYFHLRS